MTIRLLNRVIDTSIGGSNVVRKLIVLEDTEEIKNAIRKLRQIAYEYDDTRDERELIERITKEPVLRAELITTLQEDIRDAVLYDLKDYTRHDGKLIFVWDWSELLVKIKERLMKRLEELKELM